MQAIPTETETTIQARTEHNITFYVCEPLAAAGFLNAFSTRSGGVSPLPQQALNLGYFHDDRPENVTENRRRFLQAIGADGFRIITGRQVHSADLRLVQTPEDALQSAPPTDAVLSRLPQLLAGVVTADCTPVLVGDPRTGAYAAIHAGWRGTLARITERAVAKLTEEFGVQPKDCLAAIGPAAGGCCYEVGPEVVEQFAQNFTYAADLLTEPPGEKVRLDVPLANVYQLQEAGLATAQIYRSGLCTMCRPDLFFSYRRRQEQGGSGRLLSVIGQAAFK